MIAMETWYNADSTQITKVQVESFTEAFVTTATRNGLGAPLSIRRRRLTAYETYFPTFEEAKNHLIRKAQREVDAAVQQEKWARKRLEQCMEITPP
jgi:hypothetical protein